MMINDSTNNTFFCDTVQPFVKPQNDFPLASTVLIVILHIASCLFAVPTNLLVLVALIRKEHLRTAANLILTSMAASDLLVGLIVQPTIVIHKMYELYGLEFCFLRAINALVAILCVGVSFLNVCFFALDRCIATMVPYKYDSERFFNKYLAIILSSWCVLALLVVLKATAVIPSSILQLVMTLLLVASMVLILFSYIIIYRAIIGHRRRAARIAVAIAIRSDDYGTAKLHSFTLEASERPIRVLTSETDGVVRTSYRNYADQSPVAPIQGANESSKPFKMADDTACEISNTAEETTFKKQRSRSLTVSVLLSVFMVCYLPVTILNAVVRNSQERSNALTVAYDVANFLILFNSSLNPIIYCIRVQTIRKEVKALICNFRRLFRAET